MQKLESIKKNTMERSMMKRKSMVMETRIKPLMK